jgi:hypothetical protein
MTAKAKAAFVARMAAARKKKASAGAKKKTRTRPLAKRAAATQARVRIRPSVRKAKKANPAPARSARAAKAKQSRAMAARVKAKQGSTRRRLNPAEMQEAEAMYERFHGRPPERTIEYEEAWEYRSELAELGRLEELRFELDSLNKSVPLTAFGNCQVACTADGKNIYFLGGKTEIDLQALGVDAKDYVQLGPCSYIRYNTKKGFHDFQKIGYFHQFGEESGRRPVLMYDSVNQMLYLASGAYEVRPEGIVD